MAHYCRGVHESLATQFMGTHKLFNGRDHLGKGNEIAFMTIDKQPNERLTLDNSGCRIVFNIYMSICKEISEQKC